MLIDSLLKQSEDSMSANPILSKTLIKKVMSLTKDSNKYYDAYMVYSRILFNNSQFDSTIAVNKRVLAYTKSKPYDTNKANLQAIVYNTYCAYFGRIGKPDSAIYFGKEALKVNVDKTKEPDIDINISDSYNFLGQYAEAALYLRNALSVTDKYKLEDMRFPIHFALGCLYNNLKDYTNADLYFKRAEVDYNKRKDSEKEVYCNNRGNYYYFTKQYQTAVQWFKRGLPYTVNMRDSFMEALYNTNLADTYLQLKNYKVSRTYTDKAERYFSSIKFDRGLYYLTTIRIGLAIGEGNDAEARKLKTVALKQTVDDPNLKSIRNKYLENLAIKEANYKEAYEYLQKENQLNDSVRNDLTHKKIAEISLRYQQDTTLIKKEMLIQQQKAEVKTLRLGYYVWILVFVILVTSVLTIYYSLKRKHKLQREKYITQIVQYRISNIRNRISPHLLFNVLNHEMESFDEERKAHFYTLVNLLRKSLEMAEKIAVTLKDEIEFSNAYIELENYRGNGVYHTTWSIDSHIDLETTLIIPMMLQIPFENSIKHGFVDVSDREKCIHVDMTQKADSILICIADNGIGYHPEMQNTHTNHSTGTGLKVIKQTIQILNMQNNEKIQFNIHNIEDAEKTGTVTEIFIPANFKFIIR
jgi:tetratricopeptide (TPR) repeat protein